MNNFIHKYASTGSALASIALALIAITMHIL